MNKTALFFALALIFALAVPLCIARAPQEPRADGLIDVSCTTKLTTRATPEALAPERLGKYRMIYLIDAGPDALARAIWLEAHEELFDDRQTVAKIVLCYPCYREGP